MQYDLLVIGTAPAGWQGAIASAKLGKRVAVIERRREPVGGLCRHSAHLPSHALREAILQLSKSRQRDRTGDRDRIGRPITMQDLRRKFAQITARERESVHKQRQRYGVDVFHGRARFTGPRAVRVERPEGDVTLHSESILLAAGTKSARPGHIPFDGRRVFTADDLLQLDRLPQSLIVVGGGVTGIESATMLARLGVQVTVVDGGERILEFCDTDIVDALLDHARALDVMTRFGDEAIGIKLPNDDAVVVHLESGGRLTAESVLFSVGRVGETDSLNLAAAGLEADERGRLWCNDDQQTWVPHIYGVGDVVGFPAMASLSMEQGRHAVRHAFSEPASPFEPTPFRLLTIPGIAWAGKSERQLMQDGVAYEVEILRPHEILHGQAVGVRTGLVKLLFHREHRKLLGVHGLGESATEFVHLGRTVMAFGGTIDDFRRSPSSNPTSAEFVEAPAIAVESSSSQPAALPLPV